MPTWIALTLLVTTGALSTALVVMLPRLRPQTMPTPLDFTGNRRRVPHTRRPPPNYRRGYELGVRVGRHQR